ncbi:unnamed protein product, partial [Didymodactylos carnosus]
LFDEDDDKNFETFSLLWLDSNVNLTDENITTQEKLREIINYLKTFTHISKCVEWIERKQADNDKVILIVSGDYGKEIIPRIFNLPQLISIYIYCGEKVSHEEWSKNYKDKVCAVITSSDELVVRISKDQNQREKVEEATSSSMAISASSSSSSSDTSISSSSSPINKEKSLCELN